MEIDQIKFFNVVLDKTNAKLNQLQNQNIVLEAQLQLVSDGYKDQTNVINQLNQEIERLKEELARLNTKKSKTSDY